MGNGWVIFALTAGLLEERLVVRHRAKAVTAVVNNTAQAQGSGIVSRHNVSAVARGCFGCVAESGMQEESAWRTVNL